VFLGEIFILSLITGFFAQLIDGALGMAYGVSSTTVLLSFGVAPALASASVHTAEIFTTLASGASHLRLGNVDKKLFRRLLIPGMIGGALGAYILVSLPGKVVKLFVSLYLLVMGLMILSRVCKFKVKEISAGVKIILLGYIGGFFDAIGGGGWGPIVTSTLVAEGHNPRFVIGTVNLAEFFVTIIEAIVFFMLLGANHWQIIIGLIVGGVLAAPLSAYVCKKLPPRILMIIIGTVIIALSVKNLYTVFH